MKLVYGVGINDVTEIVRNCPYYKKWVGMLGRCYNPKKQAERSTYHGVTVCDEWLTFSNFKTWMQKKDWQGKELDKDIITPGNKVYCPECCCFVDKYVNNLFTFKLKKVSLYPVGVSYRDDRRNGYYVASVRIKGKTQRIGTYDDAMTAHLAWNMAKQQYINEILSDWDLEEKINNGLRLRLEKLEYAYKNNLEIFEL